MVYRLYMKLSVNLVTWNGEKYIPELFKSLRDQTFTDWSLLVIDNNSEDGTVAALNHELSSLSVQSRLIQNTENIGFARGQNQAGRETQSEYLLVLNQDVRLEPDCLAKLVLFLDDDNLAAVVSPRLMKMGESDVIDSLGLEVYRNRRAVEIGRGEKWSLNKKSAAVFGVSGTVALFRRSALKSISFPGCDFFDESYHSYKEDLDLAYRLSSAGFSAQIVMDAVAYHDRTGVGPAKKNDLAAALNKTKQSELISYQSYKNHLMTIYKNEYWQNFLLDFPWIFWYELKKFIYFLIFDRAVLAGLGYIWQNRQELKNKRGQIKKLRRVGWKQIRQWYV